MGKKRIIAKGEQAEDASTRSAVRSGKRKHVTTGVLYIQSTYNNIKMMLSDAKGNALCWSSSGSLGFSGAKKGTPFAGSKVGEVMAERATGIGVKEVFVAINGVGAGRESALRSFTSHGIAIISISDITPIPHNGPRPPKPRRV